MEIGRRTTITKIELILKVIGSVELPDKSKRELMKITDKVETTTKRNNEPDTLSDLLDLLKISAKYLVFDIEATRRENTRLMKLVKEFKRKLENN